MKIIRAKYSLLIFLLLSTLQLFGSYRSVEFVGKKNGYGVLVEYNKEQYFAVPTHILATNQAPKIKLDDKLYSIDEYLVHENLDLTLVKVNELGELSNPYVLKFTELDNVSIFSFDISQSTLAEMSNFSINELKGYSGKFVQCQTFNGMFIGCLVNQENRIKYYLAVNLDQIKNDFQVMKFELIHKKFIKKFEK